MRVLSSFVAILLFVSTVVDAGEPEKPRITGVFSNLEYIEEAGDLVGWEVFIVLGGEGHFAVVQIAEGWPAPPEVARITRDGSHVEFTLQDGTKFKGDVSEKALSGTFTDPAGGARKVILERRKSYWQ